MWRLASFSGVTKPLVFIIALPDLFAIGLNFLITTPDLLAETTTTISTDKPGCKYTRAARGSAEVLASLDFKLWDPLESTCRHASLSIL